MILSSKYEMQTTVFHRLFGGGGGGGGGMVGGQKNI